MKAKIDKKEVYDDGMDGTIIWLVGITVNLMMLVLSL